MTIEFRSFKWPKRPTTVSLVHVLGEDAHGLWLGAKQGEPWRSADGRNLGIYEQTLVKLVPPNAHWAACFHPIDPMVDVDIVQPLQWVGRALEEVDLELDILRNADGTVIVRDEDEFARVRSQWAMPDDLAAQAIAACETMRRTLIENRAEWIRAGIIRLEQFLSANR